MRKIVVAESVTLDGVMQAPGGREEDTRGGFEHGGWATPYMDELMLREMSAGFGETDLLFGRRTYEQFYSYWPTAPQPNPFTQVLNDTLKYVASRTLSEPLPWANSVLLNGDAGETVGELKRQRGKDLVVLGSGELVQALLRRDLVDRFVLSIHPLVLGCGMRLFRGDGRRTRLQLSSSVTTTTGVVIGTYEVATPDLLGEIRGPTAAQEVG